MKKWISKNISKYMQKFLSEFVDIGNCEFNPWAGKYVLDTVEMETNNNWGILNKN